METASSRSPVESIPEYTAREEFQDNKNWRIVEIADRTYRIDMKAIEPYKKVLAHGGSINLCLDCHLGILFLYFIAWLFLESLVQCSKALTSANIALHLGLLPLDLLSDYTPAVYWYGIY